MSDLRTYIRTFNENDEEIYKQYIENSKCEDFIWNNFPRLTCPDPTIEEIFAFRCWTLRKHIKKTEDGFVISEFLPEVAWSGKHNTINCALYHHLNEARWMKDSHYALEDLDFFLNEKGSSYTYYTPALKEMVDFLKFTGREDYLFENIGKLEHYLNTFDEQHRLKNGLYWSGDNYDCMECSISGMSEDGESIKGVRPTLNSYMYGGFLALSAVFAQSGEDQKADFYRKKAENLKENYRHHCKDGDFFKAVHLPEEKLNGEFTVQDLPDFHNVKEEIGYIPFAYDLDEKGDEACFRYLFDDKVFHSPYGLTTADQSHPRFLFEWDHECLWNGYIWPYATSQTINSFIRVLEKQGEHDCITDRNLYALIHDYASMHYLTENGRTVPWIDEVMSPVDGRWSSRDLLMEDHWNPKRGGYERGKDYNHSTFIDLVLRGLIGIDASADELTVHPRIQGIWTYFSVENLTYRGKTYDLYYDEDGTVFGRGKGLTVIPSSDRR